MAILRKIFHPKIVYSIEHAFPSKRAHRDRMILHYKSYIKPGDLVFDVGANLGERTKIFRTLGAKVIAIEPTAYCVKYLKSLFAGDDNVVIIDAALGSKQGVGEINVNERLPVLSTMSTKWISKSRFSTNNQWNKKEEITITTLDALIQLYGTPSFCKIDVEGFEYEVISGLSSSIPMVSFEFMFEFLDDANKIIDKLLSIYQLELNYNIGEQMDLYHDTWMDKESLFNSLRNQNNVTLWGDIYVKEKAK